MDKNPSIKNYRILKKNATFSKKKSSISVFLYQQRVSTPHKKGTAK